MTLEQTVKKHRKGNGNLKRNATKRSTLEAQFDLQLRAHNIGNYCIEYLFHPIRKWRFDYAWTVEKIAVEIEGGTWLAKSRHTSGVGFLNDCEKYDEAMRLGWDVYRVPGDFIKSGRAIETLKILLEMKR